MKQQYVYRSRKNIYRAARSNLRMARPSLISVLKSSWVQILTTLPLVVKLSKF